MTSGDGLTTVDELQARYGVEGRLTFAMGEDSFACVTMMSPGSCASVTLKGALVQSWRPAAAINDVLWMSDVAPSDARKPYRGGIPVCWPWFSAYPGDGAWPSHGPARSSAFGVVNAVASDEVVRLEMAPMMTMPVPEPIEGLQLRVVVEVGDQLTVALETQNQSERPISLTQALHTYFAISDVADIRIEGLDNCIYADALDGLRRVRQSGAVTISSEVDRIYATDGGPIRLVDRPQQRCVTIASEGSRSAVVWNPWIAKSERLGDMASGAYRRMVCIETANAGDDAISVAPGQSHRLIARIACDTLPKSN